MGKDAAEKRRERLLESLSVTSFDSMYKIANADRWNNFSFRAIKVDPSYPFWPSARDLCRPNPGCYDTGMHEGRSGSLFDISKKNLAERMKLYYDEKISWSYLVSIKHGMTRSKSGYKPRHIREKVLGHEIYDDEMIVRYAVRPFDNQWAYFSHTPHVWNRHRENMWKQHLGNKLFLVSRSSQQTGNFGRPATISSTVGDLFILSGDTELFPFYDYTPKDGILPESKVANLSERARKWIRSLDLAEPDSSDWVASAPWFHMLSICNSPRYIFENEDGLRIDRPRFPVPSSRDVLERSAKIGHRLANILDYEAPLQSTDVPEGLDEIGLIQEKNLRVSGWGSYDKEGAVQPNKRVIKTRKWTNDERSTLKKVFRSMKIEKERGFDLLGDAVDINLTPDLKANHWRGVPNNIWKFHIGRYPVIRKWLSYRDRLILGRDIDIKEARHVTDMVQRLTVLTLMTDQLDANYRDCYDNAYSWPMEE